MSASSAGVSFDGGPAPQSADVAVQAARPHNRRMYAMCPPQFQRVGTDCYSLVDQRSSWLEAYFFCKDKNANLAEPGKNADRKLRIYLERVDSQSGGNPINLLNFDRNFYQLPLDILQNTIPFGLAAPMTTATSTGSGARVDAI